MKPKTARLGLTNTCLIAATLLVMAFRIFYHEANFYEIAQASEVLVETETGFGSGAVVKRTDPDGIRRVFVWTARHVAHGARQLSVTRFTRVDHRRAGSSVFRAEIIAESEAADCALLYLPDAPASLFSDVEFDTDSRSRLGDPVFAVGNPFGPRHDGAITDGIISQFGVDFGPQDGFSWPVADETTAALNPGSSGGPVFNLRLRRIIGIAVGTSGTGVNVYVPARAIISASRTLHIEWAVSGDTCPAVDRIHPDFFRQLMHSWMFGNNATR